MYINRVQIKNFRNFADFSIETTESLVLIGENNSGKSNFLYALRLLLDPTLPESARLLDDSDFWEGVEPKFSGNIIEVTVDLTEFINNDKIMSVLCDALINDEPPIARITYSFRPRDTVDVTRLPTNELRREHYEVVYYFKGDETARTSPDIFRRWIPLELLPALRDAKSDLGSWRRSPLRPLIDSFKDKIDTSLLQSVAEEVDRITKTLLSEPNISNLQDSIVNRLVVMLESKEDIDPVELRPKIWTENSTV